MPACPQAERISSRGAQLRLLAIGLFAIPFMARAVFTAIRFGGLVLLHNDTTYPEGANVYSFLYALRTGHLYADPFTPPWNVQLYGPLYYVIGVCVARLAHADPFVTTVLFRLLSFTAFAGSAALLAWITWKLEHAKVWTGLVFLICVDCSWGCQFTLSTRPDTLSIFFFLAGLAVYLSGADQCSHAVFSGIFISLSFLTKQSVVPIVLVMLLDPLIRRNLSQAAAMLAGVTLAPAILFLTLWLHHEPFIANITAISQAFYSLAYIPRFLIESLRQHEFDSIPLAFALLGVVLSWKRPLYATVFRVTLAAWIINVAALGNVGADDNYLILPYLLSALFIPPAFIWLTRSSGRLVFVPALVGALGIAVIIHQRSVEVPKTHTNLDPTPLHGLNMLSDLSYLEIQSREPQLMDPYVYHQFALRGTWSDTPLNERVDHSDFDLVLIQGFDAPNSTTFTPLDIWNISFWGQSTIDALHRHYLPICETYGMRGAFDVLAMVPRNRESRIDASVLTSVFQTPCRSTRRVLELDQGAR